MLLCTQEVVNMMLKKATIKIVKASAVIELKRNANSTTCAAFYQPKAPAALERFKKPAK